MSPHTNQSQFLIDEMHELRTFCTLINSARNKAGFASLKYPITDVKINRYFLPEFQSLCEEECNIIGYMDIPPIEVDLSIGKKSYKKPEWLWKIIEFFGFDAMLEYTAPNNYLYVTDGERCVLLSTTRSHWQQDIYEDRENRRNLVLEKYGRKH